METLRNIALVVMIAAVIALGLIVTLGQRAMRDADSRSKWLRFYGPALCAGSLATIAATVVLVIESHPE